MNSDLDTKIVRQNASVVIWGTSERAMVVADVVRCQGAYRIAGFLDEANAEQRGREFYGSRLLGGRDPLSALRELGVRDVLLADPEPATRLGLVAWLVEMGFTLPVAIHPSAVVAGDAAIGPGTVIAAGVVVGVGTQIGNSVFVGASATIGSACTIGDAVEIGAGAHLGARVDVGREARIGIGAVVSEGSRLGIGSVTGDGALVNGSTAAYDIVTGVPATYRGMTSAERHNRASGTRQFLRSVTGQR